MSDWSKPPKKFGREDVLKMFEGGYTGPEVYIVSKERLEELKKHDLWRSDVTYLIDERIPEAFR